MQLPFIDETDELVYPERPRSRVPAIVWFLLGYLAFAASANVWILSSFLLVTDLQLAQWQASLIGWVGAVAVGTLLFTGVAWTRTPREGWQAEFPLPLTARVFLRVLVYIGGPGLVLMSSLWISGGFDPALGSFIWPFGVMIVLVFGPSLIRKWVEPIGGTEALWGRYRPRGPVRRDALTPEEVAAITDRPVREVVRLDADHPKVWAIVKFYHGLRARYVLSGDATVEVSQLYLNGVAPSKGIARRQMNELGRTPFKRMALLRKTHRLDPVPGIGEESYACIPNDGGPEWLLTRISDVQVLEIRTSTVFDRFTRMRLAETALDADRPDSTPADDAPPALDR